MPSIAVERNKVDLRRDVLLLLILALLSFSPNGVIGQTSVGNFDPDRFGKLDGVGMQAVMDNLYFLLQENPRWVGLILFDYGTDETRIEKIRRLKLISRATRFRGYDPSPISIGIAKKASELQYTFIPGERIFPVGEEDYTIVKLTDIMRHPERAFPRNK